MTSIDLNCDLGEGASNDARLMALISSANIACGGHAGDPETMRRTIALARRHGVAIGAHPGFEDRLHFGRRDLDLPAPEIRLVVSRQVAALAELVPVRHVKPHGALYNRAARDRQVADAVVAGIGDVLVEPWLIAPAGSELARAGEAAGWRVAREVFADRRYRPDGSLVPRNEPDAVIAEPAAAVRQVLQILRDRKVTTADGGLIALEADTVCIHGDGAAAVSLVADLRDALRAAGIQVERFDRPLRG